MARKKLNLVTNENGVEKRNAEGRRVGWWRGIGMGEGPGKRGGDGEGEGEGEGGRNWD